MSVRKIRMRFKLAVINFIFAYFTSQPFIINELMHNMSKNVDVSTWILHSIIFNALKAMALLYH